MLVPTIPWNPVMLMLHNEKTDRWHPILFWECPMPGGQLGDALRWKSKGHHTEGFATRDEAIAELMDFCQQSHDHKQGGDVYYDHSEDIPWDGEDIPASVMMFDLASLTKFEPTATR